MNKRDILDNMPDDKMQYYMNVTRPCRSEDGETFLIVEDWDIVRIINYEIIRQLSPDLLSGLKVEEIDGFPVLGDTPVDNNLDKELKEIGYEGHLDDKLPFVCEWGFSDEYTPCHECDKVIRIQPTSYNWLPDYCLGDGYIVCNDCFNENEDVQEEYVDDLINNHSKANTLLSREQLEKIGFKRVDADYESGLHSGMASDHPEEILRAIKEEDGNAEYVFSIDATGQFQTEFSLYKRIEVEDE